MNGSNMTHSSRFSTAQSFRFFVFPVLFVFLILLGLVVGGCSGGNSNTSRKYSPPNLDVCQNLQVPGEDKVIFRVHATGVQIYRWSGTNWIFQAPEASLFSDAGANGLVGTHYAGPTWESNSGSKVVGTVLDRCTPNQNTIPWLLLKAVSTDEPGLFHRVTHIQRVNTSGGLAPAEPGSSPGEVRNVPYTAEYFFYRSKNN
jgi:hypothetical protein